MLLRRTSIDSFHDLTYEVSACAQDKVQCDKTERCPGLCSGVDNSEFKHDFHTMVALTELSVDALGDQFDSGRRPTARSRRRRSACDLQWRRRRRAPRLY